MDATTSSVIKGPFLRRERRNLWPDSPKAVMAERAVLAPSELMDIVMAFSVFDIICPVPARQAQMHDDVRQDRSL